jgi:O-antigen/teichoic acid export membrane protein
MLDAKPKDKENGLAPRVLFTYGLAKAIPGVLMLASVPLWVRLYGTIDYGTYAVIWGSVLFSASLGTGWLRQSGLKYTGSSHNRLGNVPRRWIAASIFASGMPPAIVVWTLRDSQPAESTSVLAAASVAFAVVSAIYYLVLSVAQRDQRSGAFTLAECLRSALTLIASLVLPWMLGYSGATLIAANAIGTLVGLAVLSPGMRFSRRDAELSRSVLRDFWSFGWPMGMWQAVAAMTLYMDRFFITLFLGSSAAGTYAALADLLVRGFTILSYPILVAGHPAIMRAWNTGRRRQAMELSRLWTSRLACIVAVGIAVGVLACLLFGEWVIGARVDSSPTLWCLALGAGCWQLALMTHKGLEMAGRPRLMLTCLTLLVAVSIPANIFLIPLWGTLAAAAAFAFSATCYCVLTYCLSSRILRAHQLQEGN